MRHKAYLEGKKLPEQYSSPFEEVRCHEYRLQIPLHWRKPRRIFVNSMSDIFHPDVPFEFIHEVYWIMMHAEQHTFMILTKRPDRAIEFFHWWYDMHNRPTGIRPFWTYKNIWLGVSVENQQMAEERIPLLLQTPAAVRFISAEPLLGPIDLFGLQPFVDDPKFNNGGKLDWVICCGESGKNARPTHPDWARSLRYQCEEAGVPFFFKQWGEWKEMDITSIIDARSYALYKQTKNENIELGMIRIGKKKAGRLLDGIEHNAFPVIESDSV